MQLLTVPKLLSLQHAVKEMTYYHQIDTIIEALESEYRDDTLYQRISTALLERLLPHLTPDNIIHSQQRTVWQYNEQRYDYETVCRPIHDDNCMKFWLLTPRQPIDDALFTRYFLIRYRLYQLTNYMEHTPPLANTEPCMRSMDFARAWMLGLIPEGEVYREMMGRLTSPARIEGITMVMYNGYRNPRERDEFTDLESLDLSAFRPVAKRIVDRILDIELHRGDSATEVTKLANHLRRIYGSKRLIQILQAFGKDTFVRESYGYNREESGKRDTLSYLLKNCHPQPEDTPDLIKKLAQEAGIKDERLVAAAMFAPQWLEPVEKATGWKGLTSAAWYFRAHTSENWDDREKAIIARYTPIDTEELREGAFDIDWFKEAYHTIGQERFEVVYDAAKYISSSNSHTRARKFADAVSGKFKAADIRQEIMAKRNKDLLMAYGLIPLQEECGNRDLLERYQYLQQFLKESKDFCTQRQASEKLATGIALQNLARNSGYGDVTRLTWSMETELIKELVPYLTPHEVEGVEVEIGGPSVNPVRRKQPSELIATGIAGIDLNNTLVSGQKIPFFADPDQPFNQVMANVALRAETDKIILGGMGMTNDDYLYFKNVFSNAGALDRIISFVNTTENPPVERLLIPDMALTAAEYFAVEHNQKVLVLLTDMTSYADALAIVSNRMDQIPSKDSMPGSLYSDLAKIYEKAVQFPSGGSITIIAVTTLSGGDITHAVPDNTGYITEGQLFLRRDSDIGKVIVDPFRSLSRLKQLVSGKKTRKDHPQVMNAAVRLYADAANAKTKMENGFDLTNYDERTLAFAKDYANQLLAIDVNLNTTEMLDVTWGLFSKYFKPEEVNIKKEFVDQYWKK